MFDAIKAKNECIQWIRDWFAENGKDCSAVIGISGGKDSSVVAALCVEALGKDRVIGILMPSGIQSDIDDAKSVVAHLNIQNILINIGEAVGDILGWLYHLHIDISEQTKVNLPPRIRMTTLYAVSQSLNGRVVGTDNASEAYIGYSTRWGDNVADLMPILNFTSEEVVAIGDALDLPYDLVHKAPSDGMCGKTDEDNLGFTYEQLDNYIDNDKDFIPVEVCRKIEHLHKTTRHKYHPIPTYGIYGEGEEQL